MRQEIARLQDEEHALNAKKEQMYNLSYVEDYAENKLGMVKLDKSQVNYVEMDTGDRMVLAAAAAQPEQAGGQMLEALSHAFSAVLEYLR